MTIMQFESQLTFLLKGFGPNLRRYVVSRIVQNIHHYIMGEYREIWAGLEDLECMARRICADYIGPGYYIYDIIELVDAFIEEYDWGYCHG